MAEFLKKTQAKSPAKRKSSASSSRRDSSSTKRKASDASSSGSPIQARPDPLASTSKAKSPPILDEEKILVSSSLSNYHKVREPT
jgi:hypothetical protein